MQVNNLLTFDIEEWYHANYSNVLFSEHEVAGNSLESNVDRLLNLCSKYNIKSTCFTLGSVAEQKPHIVKKIHNSGHEIASHGHAHHLVYSMNPDKFRIDLKKSCNLLEDIIGEKVIGFRAPSWSIRKENLKWYYEILSEQGIEYSSSVYPAYTYLYGIPGFTKSPHYPHVSGSRVDVLEIPVPVFGVLNKHIGFSGGFYLRFFPAWLISQLIKYKNNKNEPTFLYLHPREIDIEQPVLKLGLLENFIHYYGIKNCESKIESLMETYSESFITCKNYSDIRKFGGDAIVADQDLTFDRD